MEHIHLPQRDDPDHCGTPGCGLVWSDPVHAPSVALRKLSEGSPDLRPLEQYERASGTPRVPSQRGAAPATHTGRPSMHSQAEYVPASGRWIMCPMRTQTVGQPRVACAFSSPFKSEVGDHLARVHDYRTAAIDFYLAHPWFANEARSDWVKRTEHLRGVHHIASKVQTPDPIRPLKRNGVTTEFHKCDAAEIHEPHLWQPGARTEWFTCRGDLQPDEEPGLKLVTSVQDSDVYEVCNHPNGFGPMGCPCGASAPDEDAPETVRRLDTDEDVPGIRCPECHEAFAETGIWMHLQGEHMYSGGAIASFLESVGLYPPSANDPETGSPIWGHQVNCPTCGNGFIKGNIRRHLQVVHQWTGDMWDDWAEEVNFLELPTVPKSIIDDMEALSKRAEAELARFMDPNVTMEQIMADAATPPDDPHAGMRRELTDWWVKLATEEADKVVPKAVEYGALDLIQIGQDLAACAGRTVTDEEAAELGVYFYLRGKLARWTDAVITGRRVSDDTLHDIGVYVRMAQRIRTKGSWPGV